MLLRALADAGFYDQDARTGMYAPSVRILLAAEWIGEQLFSEKSLLSLMELGAKSAWLITLAVSANGTPQSRESASSGPASSGSRNRLDRPPKAA